MGITLGDGPAERHLPPTTYIIIFDNNHASHAGDLLADFERTGDVIGVVDHVAHRRRCSVGQRG